MTVRMSSGIYGMLRAAVMGKMPDIRECNNVQLKACLQRGYFNLRAQSIEVTAFGYEAYEIMKDAQTPMRKNIGPLAKTVLAFAGRDLRAKLVEFSRRVA